MASPLLVINDTVLLTHAGTPLRGWYEEQEREDVATYLDPDAKVLEIGARFGTVSCTINAKLNVKTNQVSLEPDSEVWEVLRNNRAATGSRFHIVTGTLSLTENKLVHLGGGPLGGTRRFRKAGESAIPTKLPHITYEELKSKYFTPNTLVIDCEGAYAEIFEEFPALFDDLTMIRIVWDGGDSTQVNKLKARLLNEGFVQLKGGFHGVYEKPIKKA